MMNGSGGRGPSFHLEMGGEGFGMGFDRFGMGLGEGFMGPGEGFMGPGEGFMGPEKGLWVLEKGLWVLGRASWVPEMALWVQVILLVDLLLDLGEDFLHLVTLGALDLVLEVSLSTTFLQMVKVVMVHLKVVNHT